MLASPATTAWLEGPLRSRDLDLVFGALMMLVAGFVAGVVVAGPLEDVFGDQLNLRRNVILAVSMIVTALVIFDITSRVSGGQWVLLVALVLVPAVILAMIDPFFTRDAVYEALYFYWTGAVIGGLVGLVGGTGESLFRRGPVLAAVWVVTLLVLIIGWVEHEQFDVPFYVL